MNLFQTAAFIDAADENSASVLEFMRLAGSDEAIAACFRACESQREREARAKAAVEWVAGTRENAQVEEFKRLCAELADAYQGAFGTMKGNVGFMPCWWGSPHLK